AVRTLRDCDARDFEGMEIFPVVTTWPLQEMIMGRKRIMRLNGMKPPKGTLDLTRRRSRQSALAEALESRTLLAGQIYVTNVNGNAVGEFTTSGAAVNTALVPG